MKKINLNGIFESLIKGDIDSAKEKFHSYTINEGRKINNEIIKEDEDQNETSSECSVTIDLNDSDASADEINSIFDEIFSDLGIDADVVFDEEENKYTLTFDTEEEADNFNDALVDKVNSLDIDEIEIEDCDSEEIEDNLDEAYSDEYPGYSDKEEKLIEKTVNDFDVNDFFDDYGSDFGIDDVELAAEDKVLSKSDVVDSLASYLLSYSERFLEADESNPLDTEDFKDAAEDLFDEIVKPAMEEKGYSFSDKDLNEDMNSDPASRDEADTASRKIKKFMRNLNMDDYEEFLNSVDNLYGESIADAIDGQWSGDKLHYQQGMDFDITDLINNTDSILKNSYDNMNAVEEGKDLGKPGKNFAKIAKSAAKEYGSKEAGERVAGSVLSKLRKEHPRKYSEKNLKEDEIGDNQSPIDIARRMGYDAAKEGNENKFNSELRSLMNDKAGDAQREDIHKAYIEGMDEFHKGSKVDESEEENSTLTLLFPSDGDSTVVDAIESKFKKAGLNYNIDTNEIQEGNRVFQVSFDSSSDANNAEQIIEKVINFFEIQDYELSSGEEIQEDEDLDIDTDEVDSDVDTVDNESEDDKLDLILSKISELEAQLADLDTDSTDDVDVDVEEELPEDGEDYDDLSEDYKLEPVKTEPNTDGEEVGNGKKIKGNDESPMSDLEKFRLDINDKGIQSPSKNNAKGYEWKNTPKVDKNKIKGDVKNAEQKLEKVNKDDKKALVNQSQGKENDESVLGNGTMNESRKILRRRK